MRTEDGYIIYKCLNGDSSAFGLLVDKYKAGVYAVAYERLHNFHDAEDIAQEAFLKAYRSLRTLRHWDSFASWLYRITLNLCRDWLRVEYRRPDREYTEDQDQDMLDAPSGDIYRQELACESVREALDSLPESHRQILTLRYLAGMTSVEIARFAGVSPSAIRMRLSKARSLLKEEILAMMNTTFDEQRLQSTFTLRIVDAVKRIRIQPTPRTAALPWGLSLAAGIIITFLSLTPQPDVFNRVATAAGSPLHVEERTMKDGEIPVDVFEVSQVSTLASHQRDGDSTKSESSRQRTNTLMAANTENDRLTGGAVADEESIVVEPNLRFTRIYSGPKLDVIGRLYQVTVSHDGNFIFGPLGRMSSPPGWIVPLKDDQEPFKLAPEIDKDQFRVVWSPDMKKLALISRPRGDLFVMPFSPETGRVTGPAEKILEGTDAQKEFSIYKRVTPPAWSPDGQRIAFSWAESGNFDIWTIPATGGEPKQLTSDPQDERSPFWLPDGEKILFSRDREIPGSQTRTWDVFLVPSEGGTAEKIIEDAYSPWGVSANGEWLAFRRRPEEFGILRLTDMQQVSVNSPEELGEPIGWSGNKLLFYKSGMEERSELRVVPAYGGPSVELGKGIIVNSWLQDWSPDGKFIVTEGGEGFAWIVPSAGGSPVKLRLDPKMTKRGPLDSFSPDLTRYAFIDLDADRSLWVAPVSIEGRQATGPAVKISGEINRSGSVQ